MLSPVTFYQKQNTFSNALVLFCFFVFMGLFVFDKMDGLLLLELVGPLQWTNFKQLTFTIYKNQVARRDEYRLASQKNQQILT